MNADTFLLSLAPGLRATVSRQSLGPGVDQLVWAKGSDTLTVWVFADGRFHWSSTNAQHDSGDGRVDEGPGVWFTRVLRDFE